MKFSGYLILVLLIACRCKETTETIPNSSEFGGLAPFIDNGHYKTFELLSLNGLTGIMVVSKLTSTELVDNSNCKHYSATFPKLSYRDETYGFEFNLTFMPVLDGDRLNLSQFFWNENINLRSSSLTFDIDKQNTTSNSIHPIRGDVNYLTTRITHHILDTFTTSVGTYKLVHFFSNSGWHNVPDPRAIVEFYVDKSQGLVRFKTKDENIWDIKY